MTNVKTPSRFSELVTIRIYLLSVYGRNDGCKNFAAPKRVTKLIIGGFDAYLAIRVPGNGSASPLVGADFVEFLGGPSLSRTVSCDIQLVFPELPEP